MADIENDPSFRENIKLYRNTDAVQPQTMAEMETDGEEEGEFGAIPLDQLVDEFEEMGVEDQEMSG